MILRDVRLDDLDAYIAMRCDPVMMAELGGPRPRDSIADKVRRDVEDVESGAAWICMVIADEARPVEVAGTVTIWSHDAGAGAGADEISEIGWMVLPGFQGRGVASEAVRQILARARADRRWGAVHAYPSVSNAPSNGVCRSAGFSLVAAQDLDYAGQRMRVNHWVIQTSG
jgi:RimJ/RimL family protein N-acetyltransferase